MSEFTTEIGGTTSERVYWGISVVKVVETVSLPTPFSLHWTHSKHGQDARGTNEDRFAPKHGRAARATLRSLRSGIFERVPLNVVEYCYHGEPPDVSCERLHPWNELHGLSLIELYKIYKFRT